MFRGYRSAVVAIGLALLCGSQALAQHPGLSESGQAKQNEQIEQEQRKTENDQGPKPTPAATQADQRETDHRDTAGSEPNQRTSDYLFWGEPPAQWVMAAASVVSVVVASVAVILVWCTLREARKTTLAAIRSVVQARRAAKAAEDTVIITQEIGRKQIRAYLSVADASVSAEQDGTVVKFRTNIKIKNSGHSPAKIVSFKPAYFRPTIKYNEKIYVGDFGSGEERWEGHTAAFEINDLKYPPDENDTVHFEVEITLSYRDVFNDAHGDFRHWFSGRPALTNAPHPLNRVRTQVVALGAAIEHDTAGPIDVNRSTRNEAD